MSEKAGDNLLSVTSAAGFEPVEGDGARRRYVTRSPAKSKGRVDGPKKRRHGEGRALNAMPWRLGDWQIRVAGETWQTEEFRLELEVEGFLRTVGELAKETFGAGTVQEVQATGDAGQVWLLFEFTRPRAKNLAPNSLEDGCYTCDNPSGAGGLRLEIGIDGPDVVIRESDHFALGFIPPKFCHALPDLIARALGLSLGQASARGYFEQRYPVSAILRNWHAHRHGKGPTQTFFREMGEATRGLVEGSSILLERLSPSEWRLTGRVREGSGRQMSAPGIEVLEERELKDAYGKIDEGLLDGRLEQARRLCLEELAASPNSLFLIRRMAILSLGGRAVVEDEALSWAVGVEPDNKLFLSCQIKQALRLDEKKPLLAAVSALGERLDQDVPSLERAKTLELVLPELLGDSWYHVDRETAEACYQRILLSRGDLPRVLTKLVGLAQASDDRDTEIALLGRLLAAEQRKSRQAQVHKRLAEIYRSTEPLEAIRSALAALRLQPGAHHIAVFAAEVMVGENQAREAIQVLTDTLAEIQEHKDPLPKAELELTIGTIWASELQRPDLAKKRYANALVLAAESKSFLDRLAQAFAAVADVEGMARTLEAAFDLCLKRGDETEIRRLGRELIELYRGELKAPKRAQALYERMILNYVIEPDEIAKLMTWSDVEIDWQEFYRGLSSRMQTVNDPDLIKAYHSRLGEISLKKLGDREQAAHHFKVALRLGQVEPQAFRFLKEYLYAEHDFRSLAECLKIRIELSDGRERVELLQELFRLPEGVSDDQLDVYAVMLIKLNNDFDEELRRRLAHYGKENLPARIDRLTVMVLTEIPSAAFARYWLEEAIDTLTGMAGEERFAVMARLVTELGKLALDEREFLPQAIAWLKPAEDLAHLRPFVVRAVGLGLCPDLPEERIVEFLHATPNELGLYHEMLAFSEGDDHKATHHAKLALAAFAELSGLDAKIERLMLRYGALAPLTVDEMTKLAGLTARSGHDEAFQKCLATQVELAVGQKAKYEMLRFLIERMTERGDAVSDVIAIYERMIPYAPSPEVGLFELARYAKEHLPPIEAKAYAIRCLENEACWPHQDELHTVLGWLIDQWGEIETVKNISISRVEGLAKVGRKEEAASLAELLAEFGVFTRRLSWITLEYHAERRDFSGIVESWCRRASLLTDTRQTKQFLSDTKALFEKNGEPELLEKVIEQCTRSGFPSDLALGVEAEFKLYYARKLFDKGVQTERALELFRQYYAMQPADHRAWIPLYFLLKEHRKVDACIALLSEIIPRLEHNDQALSYYPVTLESLKGDLAKLRTERLNDGPLDVTQVKPLITRAPPPPAGAAAGDLAAPDVTDKGERSEIMTPQDAPGESPAEIEPKEAEPREAASEVAATTKERAAAEEAEPVEETAELEGEFSQDVGTKTGFLIAKYNEAAGFEEGQFLDEPSSPTLIVPESPLPPPPPDLVAVVAEAHLPTVTVVREAQPVVESRTRVTASFTNAAVGAVSLPDVVTRGLKVMENYQVPKPARGVSVSMWDSQGRLLNDLATQIAPERREQSKVEPVAARAIDDWREMAAKAEFFPGMTTAIMNMAFESELEKHVAIQAFGLISGELDILDSWQFRVWRHPNEYGYDLTAKGRYPKLPGNPLVGGHLHQLITYLSPLIVQYFENDFSLVKLSKQLGLPPKEFINHRRPILWNEPFFQTVGLHLYREELNRHRFVAFMLDGLGATLFFDGRHRAIYFDPKYYRTRPPPHLFHRLMATIRAVRMNYYVPLALDPVKQMLPFLKHVRAAIQHSGLTGVKMALGVEKDPLKLALSQMDQDRLASLYRKIGKISTRHLEGLWQVLWHQVYRVQLAETLDLVGLTESITNTDLFRAEVWEPREILAKNQQVAALVQFALKLGL